MTAQFGVDEAGKGPVLGSMVVAAVSGESHLLPAGLNDSKRLTPRRRTQLAEQLRAAEGIQIATVHVTPDEIDDETSNLNELTAAAHGAAIKAVATEGMSGCADAADTDIERYSRRVEDAVGFVVDLDAKHKADETDVFVSAASVIAKVERDTLIDDLRDELGEVGSGYPSDPTTREFLKEYISKTGTFPPCTRESWKTCDKLRAEVEQQKISE
jgi:ribonuclease HII